MNVSGLNGFGKFLPSYTFASASCAYAALGTDPRSPSNNHNAQALLFILAPWLTKKEGAKRLLCCVSD